MTSQPASAFGVASSWRDRRRARSWRRGNRDTETIVLIVATAICLLVALGCAALGVVVLAG